MVLGQVSYVDLCLNCGNTVSLRTDGCVSWSSALFICNFCPIMPAVCNSIARRLSSSCEVACNDQNAFSTFDFENGLYFTLGTFSELISSSRF